ncbi:hypothetical protein P9112_004384 [Eukaryota sp. TZLM1-RC]
MQLSSGLEEFCVVNGLDYESFKILLLCKSPNPDQISPEIYTKLFINLNAFPHMTDVRLCRRFFSRFPHTLFDSNLILSILPSLSVSESLLVLVPLLTPPLSNVLPSESVLSFLESLIPRVQTVNESTTFARTVYWYLRSITSIKSIERRILNLQNCLVSICMCGLITNQKMEFSSDYLMIKDATATAFTGLWYLDKLISKRDNLFDDVLNILKTGRKEFSLSMNNKLIPVSGSLLGSAPTEIQILMLKSLISIEFSRKELNKPNIELSFWKTVDFVVSLVSINLYLTSSVLNSLFSNLKSVKNFSVPSEELNAKILFYFNQVFQSSQQVVNYLWQQNLKLYLFFLNSKSVDLSGFYKLFLSLAESNQHKYSALSIIIKINPSFLIDSGEVLNLLTSVLKACNDPNVCQLLDEFLFSFMSLIRDQFADWVTIITSAVINQSEMIENSRKALFLNLCCNSLVRFGIKFSCCQIIKEHFFNFLNVESSQPQIFLCLSFFSSVFRQTKAFVDKFDLNQSNLIEFLLNVLKTQSNFDLLTACLLVLSKALSVFDSLSPKFLKFALDSFMISFLDLLGSDGYGNSNITPLVENHAALLFKRHPFLLESLLNTFCDFTLNVSPQNRKFSCLTVLKSLFGVFKISFSDSNLMINNTIIPSNLVSNLVNNCCVSSWVVTRGIALELCMQLINHLPIDYFSDCQSTFFGIPLTFVFDRISFFLSSEVLKLVDSGATLFSLLLHLMERTNFGFELSVSSDKDCLFKLTSSAVSNDPYLILNQMFKILNTNDNPIRINGLLSVLLTVITNNSIAQKVTQSIIDTCHHVINHVIRFISRDSDFDEESGDFTSFRTSSNRAQRLSPSICRQALQILIKISPNFDSDQHKFVSKISVDLLSSVRHVGIIHDLTILAKITLSKCSNKLRQSIMIDFVDLIDNGKISPRRRSAGVPFLLTSLLSAEYKDASSSSSYDLTNILLERMQRSLRTSSDQNITSSDQNITSSTVNYLNVFASICNDSSAFSLISNQFDYFSALIIPLLNLDNWDVQSATSRCMSVMSDRLFGSKKGSSAQNVVDLDVFVSRFPETFKVLQTSIKCNVVDGVIDLVLGSLCFFQRIQSKSSSVFIFDLISCISKLLGSPFSYIRYAAGKAIASLIPAEFLVETVDRVISSCHQSMKTNIFHGNLLTVVYLLERINFSQLVIPSKTFFNLQKLYLFESNIIEINHLINSIKLLANGEKTVELGLWNPGNLTVDKGNITEAMKVPFINLSVVEKLNFVDFLIESEHEHIFDFIELAQKCSNIGLIVKILKYLSKISTKNCSFYAHFYNFLFHLPKLITSKICFEVSCYIIESNFSSAPKEIAAKFGLILLKNLLFLTTDPDELEFNYIINLLSKVEGFKNQNLCFPYSLARSLSNYLSKFILNYDIVDQIMEIIFEFIEFNFKTNNLNDIVLSHPDVDEATFDQYFSIKLFFKFTRKFNPITRSQQIQKNI